MVPTEAPKHGEFDLHAAARDAAAGAVAGAISQIPEVASKLAKVGGTRALWGAVIVLSGAMAFHILDSRRISRMESLVEWLVLCEEARQNELPPPPLPFKLRIP